MARPGMVIQLLQASQQMRTQRIEVDVAHELEKIRLLLDQERLEPILKELTGASVSSIESHRVPRVQTSHDIGQRGTGRSQQEVKVVVEQGPGENLEVCLVDQRRQPGEQVYAVGIIDEDGPPLDASDDHVVQTARSVETGASRA